MWQARFDNEELVFAYFLSLTVNAIPALSLSAIYKNVLLRTISSGSIVSGGMWIIPDIRYIQQISQLVADQYFFIASGRTIAL